MYYPVLRGKQFELLLLREKAQNIKDWGFIPIIEPVKKNSAAIGKAIKSLTDSECQFLIVANPIVGELVGEGVEFAKSLVTGYLKDYKKYSIAINLIADHTIEDAIDLLDVFKDYPISIIHNGFTQAKVLALHLSTKPVQIENHIFIENLTSSLYRKHFSGKRVLIEDKFRARTNREYPAVEPFSDLYLTYTDLSMTGFGDYLIVSSEYRESGGPAHAVAIHITYVNPESDDAIEIKHYVSLDQNSPDNTGAKFIQSLDKLYADIHKENSEIYLSDAINELMDFHSSKHFPGLGYVKKLSMQHHMELIASVCPKTL